MSKLNSIILSIVKWVCDSYLWLFSAHTYRLHVPPAAIPEKQQRSLTTLPLEILSHMARHLDHSSILVVRLVSHSPIRFTIEDSIQDRPARLYTPSPKSVNSGTIS